MKRPRRRNVALHGEEARDRRLREAIRQREEALRRETVSRGYDPAVQGDNPELPMAVLRGLAKRLPKIAERLEARIASLEVLKQNTPADALDGLRITAVCAGLRDDYATINNLAQLALLTVEAEGAEEDS